MFSKKFGLIGINFFKQSFAQLFLKVSAAKLADQKNSQFGYHVLDYLTCSRIIWYISPVNYNYLIHLQLVNYNISLQVYLTVLIRKLVFSTYLNRDV
jgi:hypothetical protein